MSGWALLEKALAGRWIAGPRIKDAAERSARFNRLGIGTEINYLGEDFRTKAEVRDAVQTYFRLIDEIKRDRLDADISLKPTQLGLLISRRLAKDNYGRIVARARSRGIFVWLDMEDAEHVDDTISFYMAEVGRGNVGICVQAYLRRSAADIRGIVAMGGIIRLVKGAYSVKGNGAFKTKPAVDRDYMALMEYLFKRSKKFMVATHDTKMIKAALRLNGHYNRDVTYAMLNGIRNRYAIALARSGHRVSLYVPFGSRWVDYSYRRLKEAGHLSLIIRSLFERQSV
ncbi:MAG: proline dehydrogenase family protein [Candidatus Micrarchaeota archaeon]|nr:proline dehydrogenase family protein [Candidatus Micrarchaeota archaeon]